jgi:hypothetical protein
MVSSNARAWFEPARGAERVLPDAAMMNHRSLSRHWRQPKTVGPGLSSAEAIGFAFCGWQTAGQSPIAAAT